MFVLPTTMETIKVEFPEINNWLKVIQENFIGKKIDDSKVNVFYTYGFFVPRSKKLDDYPSHLELSFKERLEFELSKLRIDVNLICGKFAIKNRIDFPVKSVVDLVTELTKIRMTIETEYTGDQNVKSSIPPFSRDIKIKIIRGGEEVRFTEEKEDFDLNTILDKISNTGMDSLTTEEKEFLNNISREI
jgi:hypothetical protein